MNIMENIIECTTIDLAFVMTLSLYHMKCEELPLEKFKGCIDKTYNKENGCDDTIIGFGKALYEAEKYIRDNNITLEEFVVLAKKHKQKANN